MSKYLSMNVFLEPSAVQQHAVRPGPGAQARAARGVRAARRVRLGR